MDTELIQSIQFARPLPKRQAPSPTVLEAKSNVLTYYDARQSWYHMIAGNHLHPKYTRLSGSYDISIVGRKGLGVEGKGG